MTRFAALLAVVLAVALPSFAQSPEGVVVGIGLSADGPPLGGPARALAVGPDGDVWATGQFGYVDGLFDSVARWDGPGWQSVASFSNPVRTVAVGADGATYIGGESWYIEGGETIFGVARWTGSGWEALGTGVGEGYDPVRVILPGADGEVVVGGNFTRAGSAAVANVARWTGSAWEAIGAGLGGRVETMARGADGVLYAGGQPPFGPVAGEPLTGAMRWDGSAWESIGDVVWHAGQPGSIAQLVAAPDGRLFARGTFIEIGGVTVREAAVWDGEAWASLGGETHSVGHMAVSASGEVWMVGSEHEGTTSQEFLWRWVGGTWEEVAGPMVQETPGGGITLAGAPDGSLVAGGVFRPVGKSGSEYAVRWTGAAWEALGSRVDRRVSHAVAAPGGSVYVAGDFRAVPSHTARHVAEWTGSEWRALGAGAAESLRDIDVAPDGTLYAAGYLYDLDGEPNERLAPVMRWNGEAWDLLRDPVRSFAGDALTIRDGEPHVLAYDVDFQAPAVFRWTGTLWDPVTASVETGSVSALATGPDGAFYVSGEFGFGDAETPLLRWTGTAWAPVPGFENWISAQSVRLEADGALYAVGWLRETGDPAIARLGANDWVHLPSPPLSYATSVAIAPDGHLYAGGYTDGAPMNVVVVWDGATWEPAVQNAPGEYAVASALAFNTSGDLLIGGSFASLAGVPTSNVALYQPAVMDASETPTAPLVRSVTIAPNPARGAARLTATVAPGAAEVSIYDALGRRVALAFDGETAGALSVPLDLGGLAPGVYLVRLRTADGVETARFTVTR